MSLLLLIQQFFMPLMAIDVGWENITSGISRLFTGGNWTDPAGGGTHWVEGILGGDPIIIAIIMFLFFFILAGMFGLGMVIGSVVLLPLMFALFQYIPPLRIIVAIILGIVFGIGLHRIIRR